MSVEKFSKNLAKLKKLINENDKNETGLKQNTQNSDMNYDFLLSNGQNAQNEQDYVEEDFDDEEDEYDQDEEEIEEEEENFYQSMSYNNETSLDLSSDVIQVNCNKIVGDLHKKKLGSGNKGRCIRVLMDNKEERWLTPIEFEAFCGKSNCKDWKKTIKAGGRQLLSLLESKVLMCHAVSCSCGICNENEILVGPIVPFIRYRRRKKAEKQMVNAYKKFLNLKPPTLLYNQSLSNFNIKNNNSTSSEHLLNNLSSNQLEDQLGEVAEEQQNANEMLNIANYEANQNEFRENALALGLQKFEKSQLDLWESLEQKVDSIIYQAQMVKSEIEKAKNDTNTNFKNLIEVINSTSSLNNNFNASNPNDEVCFDNDNDYNLNYISTKNNDTTTRVRKRKFTN